MIMKKQRLILAAFSLLSSVVAFGQTLEDAKRLTENEQYEAASAAYMQLISKEPANAALYYYFGDNLLLAENPDSARLILEKGKTLDASSGLIKIGQAKELLNRVNAKEAKAATQKDPGDAELQRRAADAERDVASAMTLIGEAIAGAPQKSATVYIEAADALIRYKNKNFEQAETYLKKAKSIEPKNKEIDLLYGDIYTELNNGSLAAEYYNNAGANDRSSPRAIVSKGRLYKRSTNYDGAAAEFETAISLDANYAPAHRELAETYFKMGKLEKAKEEYRRYLDLSRNNCNARMRYASFLYLGKEYAGAITEMEQVMQRCDPKNPQPLRIIAISYYETKEYKKGMEAINKVFSMLPEDRRVSKDFEYYGKLLLATEQDSLGIENLKRAYATDPSRVELLSDLGAAYLKQKKYSDVVRVMNDKISIGKDVKSLDYFNLGKAYFYESMFADADRSFSKLNELSPRFASGYYWRGRTQSFIDSTYQLGAANPFYDKFIELATVDSATVLKNTSLLSDVYKYFAIYYNNIAKDKEKTILYLRKRSELAIDPKEKEAILNDIKSLESGK
ncbi:MAG: hypothetical protein RL213_1177 [Bacteroidota bacterium]|jgi:tetratricopeptide (TPR) repeat protein